jgi:Dna[CI] antecedent, DciA
VKRLADDVKRELSRFGSGAGLAELVDAWPAAVGETIARNAWPARVARDGTLHVNTADSVWAFELTARRAEIAARVGVDSVKFAPGRLPEPASSEDREARPPRARVSDASVAEGERLAATIEDENLRKIVARAAAASLESGRDDRSV